MDDQLLPPAATLTVAGPSPRPFVGRVRELADLGAAVDRATVGWGSLTLVTGEPGIGKTRLISELGARAATRGVAVVTGRCWEEGGAPPYWPWIQVLRGLGGDLEALAARPTSADVVAGGVSPEGERMRLFDEVGRFLVTAS